MNQKNCVVIFIAQTGQGCHDSGTVSRNPTTVASVLYLTQAARQSGFPQQPHNKTSMLFI